MSALKPRLTSINGQFVPPAVTSFYFADCSNPEPSKIAFDKQVPAGKSVLAYEHALHTRQSIESEESELGDCNYLDSFVSAHGCAIEREVEAYATFAKFQLITGTRIGRNGKILYDHVRGFLVVDDAEYKALYAHIAEFVAKLQEHDKELLMAQERTKLAGFKATEAQALAETARYQLLKAMLDSDASMFWDMIS